MCPLCQTHEYATRATILKEAKSQTESKVGDANASEFGAVTIDFNPGPDAQDRLRRLFTLLLNHTAREGDADAGEGLPADAPTEDIGALETSARDAHGGDAL